MISWIDETDQSLSFSIIDLLNKIFEPLHHSMLLRILQIANPMIIWPAFRIGRYRVNDHPYHVPQFTNLVLNKLRILPVVFSDSIRSIFCWMNNFTKSALFCSNALKNKILPAGEQIRFWWAWVVNFARRSLTFWKFSNFHFYLLSEIADSKTILNELNQVASRSVVVEVNHR